jgi:hypothetical protein
MLPPKMSFSAFLRVVSPENQQGMRTGAADDVLEAALVRGLCEGTL